MCGIVGYWDPDGACAETVDAMASRLQHRGPDDAGTWVDQTNVLAMAHRRLAVIDCSPAGHQPMTSPCGRYTLVFNGEIYNHRKLRRELESENGHFDWRGYSDSETLLAGLRHWGVEGCLERVNGMFAFALWDSSERRLFLARDRMGEKPLYFGRCGSVFFFCSELSSLAVHPRWVGAVDRVALASYIRHNYVPAPQSIFAGIGKLEAAHFVVIEDAGEVVTQHCYWDLREIASEGMRQPLAGFDEAIGGLDNLLRDSLRLRLESDVPLGALLSGGIDSTLIVGAMQAVAGSAVKTFTIGFEESSFDEAKDARKVSEHLGTDHTELYVKPKDGLALVDRLPRIWDEPFADASQIPTLLVSELARTEVTVCLSGDAGDELFYGYDRYFHGDKVWKKLRRIPNRFRGAVAKTIQSIPGGMVSPLQALLPARYRVDHLADRLPKLAATIASNSAADYYRNLMSGCHAPLDVLSAFPGSMETSIYSDIADMCGEDLDFPHWMMLADSMNYLPDDILTKVDRASMSQGLEMRVPLLDHKIVEYAWRIPFEHKLSGSGGKHILRELVTRYVPKQLIDRPKHGFSVPLESWLRAELREWAEDLLNESKLSDQGYFNADVVMKLWREHQSGSRRWHNQLWSILMFQAWILEHEIGSAH